MHIDYWFFDLINGIAGRYPLLDLLGRWLAVYGLLALVLVVLALLWWPQWSRDERRRVLVGMLTAVAVCALLMAIEWWVTTQLLHHDLRARPATSRWATLLITGETHLSFPAWPVVISVALAWSCTRLSKWGGRWVMLLAGVLALSLVFVGVNYPLDVLTGAMLGIAIGVTAVAVAWPAATPVLSRVRTPILLWGGMLVWSVLVALTIKPAHTEGDVPTRAVENSSIMVPAPPAVAHALTDIARPGAVTMQAATNGHLLAGSVQIVLPNAQVPLPAVEGRARTAVNALFAHWPALGLVTVDISAKFQQGSHTHVGTLYTTTVARSQWPTAGFSSRQKLPGKKFYHAQFYRPGKHAR